MIIFDNICQNVIGFSRERFLAPGGHWRPEVTDKLSVQTARGLRGRLARAWGESKDGVLGKQSNGRKNIRCPIESNYVAKLGYTYMQYTGTYRWTNTEHIPASLSPLARFSMAMAAEREGGRDCK